VFNSATSVKKDLIIYSSFHSTCC